MVLIFIYENSYGLIRAYLLLVVRRGNNFNIIMLIIKIGYFCYFSFNFNFNFNIKIEVFLFHDINILFIIHMQLFENKKK